METLVLIAVLAAIAVGVDAAAIQSNPPILVGVAQSEDKLLMDGGSMLTPPDNPDFAGSMTLRYRLGGNALVNLVKIIEQGPPQGGAPSFVGGLGTNYVTVTLTAAKGKGFQYRVELWGNDN